MNTLSSTILIDGRLWKLVPVEPTREMCQALLNQSDWAVMKAIKAYGPARDFWRAMLAAAPEAPEQVAQPTGDLVSRSEVLRICKELGAIELDYALEGLPENARTREAAEAMAVRIRSAVAIMPSSSPAAEPVGYLVCLKDEFLYRNGTARMKPFFRDRPAIGSQWWSKPLYLAPPDLASARQEGFEAGLKAAVDRYADAETWDYFSAAEEAILALGAEG